MSARECQTADWYQIGLRDFRNNEPISRIDLLTEACSKAKVSPDKERYFSGRDEGLREYCTPVRGYLVGKNGLSVIHTCPRELVEQFMDSYRDGLRLYCTPSNGFQLGNSGASFNPICPIELAVSFEANYRQGRQLYEDRQRELKLEAKCQDLESKLQRLESELSKANTDKEKHRIHEEQEESESELSHARDELRFIRGH